MAMSRKLVRAVVEKFGALPSPESSAKTQRQNTFPTYEKAKEILDKDVGEDKPKLDYGAGLGLSGRLGFDTYEPFPVKFSPTFTDPSNIPDNSYEGVTNLNVLNVVPPETRDLIVKDIGRILSPDGTAIITTRGRDVLNAAGTAGPEDMSIITSVGTYQKGFTQKELREYLKEILGDGFDVSSVKLGPAGAKIKKLPDESSSLGALPKDVD